MAIPLESLSYTALNLHTANKSSKSLCGIGIMVVENGVKTKQEYILVKPKTNTFSNSQYGYFSVEDVKNAPTLKEIWPQLSSYIINKNIVVYDMDKSLKILADSLSVYGIELPPFPCVDIRDMFNINHAGGWSYAALSKTCGYDDYFRNGNVMENLNLYKACIEYGAGRGNTILQNNFGVESVRDTVPKNNKIQEDSSSASSASSASNDTDDILKKREDYLSSLSPEERAKVEKKENIGCVALLLIVIAIIAWLYVK